MPDRGTQPPSLPAASPGVPALNSSSGGGDDKCGCNTTPARTYAVSPCANLTVETGHFPSCPLIEIRRPCNSSSQTFSTVPAFPSVRTTALPTSSDRTSSSAPRIVSAWSFAVGMVPPKSVHAGDADLVVDAPDAAPSLSLRHGTGSSRVLSLWLRPMAARALLDLGEGCGAQRYRSRLSP